MKRALTIVFVVLGSALAAQPGPWETVAPSGSSVFTDIKDAAKNASTAYRLQLDGALNLEDKKQLARISTLKSLMALRLNNNGLTHLPGQFLSLSTLVYFSSVGNSFVTLPDSIGMLGNLKFLELQQTAFDTLPDGIYGLSRMQSLMINGNSDTLCFTSSVKMISKRLTDLRLYNTILDTLPDEFSQLTQLRKLVLYKCKLNEIPPQLYALNQLSELWLDSNNISVFPSSIARMEGLTYLSLRSNRITKVPSTICFLKELLVLDLRGNLLDSYDVQVVQALLPNCRVLF